MAPFVDLFQLTQDGAALKQANILMPVTMLVVMKVSANRMYLLQQIPVTLTSEALKLQGHNFSIPLTKCVLHLIIEACNSALLV